MSTVSKWADEAPEVMGRLVTDTELQRQVLDALYEIVGEEEPHQQRDVI